jgi:hypothetical protein
VPARISSIAARSSATSFGSSLIARSCSAAGSAASTAPISSAAIAFISGSASISVSDTSSARSRVTSAAACRDGLEFGELLRRRDEIGGRHIARRHARLQCGAWRSMMASICFSETEVILSLSFQSFVIPDLIRDRHCFAGVALDRGSSPG